MSKRVYCKNCVYVGIIDRQYCHHSDNTKATHRHYAYHKISDYKYLKTIDELNGNNNCPKYLNKYHFPLWLISLNGWRYMLRKDNVYE